MSATTAPLRYFTGAFAFLDNNHFSPITVRVKYHNDWRKLAFGSIQHAIWAYRLTNFADINRIRCEADLSLVRRQARVCALREDWYDNRERIMRDLIAQKFVIFPELYTESKYLPPLAFSLAATGEMRLEFNSPWPDDLFWGVESVFGLHPRGENKLGELLMQQRAENNRLLQRLDRR